MPDGGDIFREIRRDHVVIPGAIDALIDSLDAAARHPLSAHSSQEPPPYSEGGGLDFCSPKSTPEWESAFSRLEVLIYRHERFEQRILYEFISEQSGGGDGHVEQLSDEHDDLRRIVTTIRTIDPGHVDLRYKALLLLRQKIFAHILDEESIIPLVCSDANSRTSSILAKEYTRARDEGARIPPVGSIPLYVETLDLIDMVLERGGLANLSIDVQEILSVPRKDITYFFGEPTGERVALSLRLDKSDNKEDVPILVNNIIPELISKLESKGADVTLVVQI